MAIRELAGRRGSTWRSRYAYSDSESDLPMLRAVGHPVVVNPDRELDRIARDEGWQIMRFDKLGAPSQGWRRGGRWSGCSARLRAASRQRGCASGDRAASGCVARGTLNAMAIAPRR